MRGSFFKKEKEKEKDKEKEKEREKEKEKEREREKEEKKEKREEEKNEKRDGGEKVEEAEETKKTSFTKYENETVRDFRQRRVIQGWVNHLLSVAGYNTIGSTLSYYQSFTLWILSLILSMNRRYFGGLFEWC